MPDSLKLGRNEDVSLEVIINDYRDTMRGVSNPRWWREILTWFHQEVFPEIKSTKERSSIFPWEEWFFYTSVFLGKEWLLSKLSIEDLIRACKKRTVGSCKILLY
ncbi:hypothetical protein CleRT_08980 [Candidatus Coxiella mudrowiae]|uniref:Uncharacterized protein n=1 Tax=Candidatus Coxiella mudrowiae TaxID=2054173 RepID=A0ABM5UUM8_9COXI|nr:hypothetical protein CleRT_08980 [Candidatus Coxiella mudrowiae]